MPKEISQALDPWRETPFGGTRIYSVEKEEAIFRAAMHYIPGRRAKDGFKIFNDTAVATTNIQGYQRAEFEELALRHLLPPDLNAAWLDFTGFPTDRRISAIVELWHTTQVDTLTVTFLKARQPRQITALLKDAGGLTKLLLGILADSYLIDDHEYFDGSPMHQVTVRRDPEDCPARVA